MRHRTLKPEPLALRVPPEQLDWILEWPLVWAGRRHRMAVLAPHRNWRMSHLSKNYRKSYLECHRWLVRCSRNCQTRSWLEL
jgi:hypothetical protein